MAFDVHAQSPIFFSHVQVPTVHVGYKHSFKTTVWHTVIGDDVTVKLPLWNLLGSSSSILSERWGFRLSLSLARS